MRLLLPLLFLCAVGLLFAAPVPRGRSVTVAPHGMVCASQPLAAQIGLDVLKAGGTAVDAAIATNAALGLMEPTSCGVGGDLFALVWDAKTQKLYGLDASGRSPAKHTRALFAEKGLKEIPTRGPLSWSVPGCVDGWEQLRSRFGKFNFEQLLAPAIRYAEEGFPVSEVIAGSWRASERGLKEYPEAATVFLPGGRAPRAGEPFRNPALAATYREIAKGGRDAYYQGRIARDLLAYSDKVGGLLSAKDLADTHATWVEPVNTEYRGHTVWALPPAGQGIAVLQMLNLLSAYDLKQYGPDSADYWHLFAEAKKVAYADRAAFYADPGFSPAPVPELISPKYADERRKLIDVKKASTTLAPGDPKLGRSETVYFCAVDKDRNCVSMIQSNYMGFGSGNAIAALGFGLQNRGCLFALDDKHANRLEPGKRPFHTIIPGFVTKNGKPFFTFGVMGGDMQPQGQVQVLVNLLDFGMNVQQAGEAARIEHTGSATPTGKPGDRDGGTLRLEPGIPLAVEEELRRRGHVTRRERVNGGGYQGILIHPETGMLHGGSEVRKDGLAAGW